MDFRAELAKRAMPIVVLMAAVSCGPSDTAGAPAASAQVSDRVFAGGAAPPEESLENPFEDDSQSVAEGERLFGAMNCAECHGGGALGFVGPSLRRSISVVTTSLPRVRHVRWCRLTRSG